jgi:hypothetical protein
MNTIEINETTDRFQDKQLKSSFQKAGNWFGRVVQAGLQFLYSIPISFIKIISYIFIPQKETEAPPLKDKLIEPIPSESLERQEEPIEPPGPLDLSNEELLLCTSGLFKIAGATTGLPWGLQWLGGSTTATLFFRSATLTNPTTPMGILFPLLIKRINPRIQVLDAPMSQEVDTFSLLSYGCAPIATAKQAHLTFKQTMKAINGIKTCIDSMGSENSFIIARNLAVHSVNITTAAFNLLTSLKVSAPELLAISSYVLKYATSEDYAYETMGSLCPVPFMEKTHVNTPPPLSENPSFYEKFNFGWNVASNFLFGGPIAQCHYRPGSKEDLEHENWTYKQGLKTLGSEWFGIKIES